MKRTNQISKETHEQLIARLAPGYEECTHEEADQEVGSIGRAGLILLTSGWELHADLMGDYGPASDYICLRKSVPVKAVEQNSAECIHLVSTYIHARLCPERARIAHDGLMRFLNTVPSYCATAPMYQCCVGDVTENVDVTVSGEYITKLEARVAELVDEDEQKDAFIDELKAINEELHGSINKLKTENIKLKTALEGAAESLRSIATSMLYDAIQQLKSTPGTTAYKLRNIKEYSIESARACWTALGEWP